MSLMLDKRKFLVYNILALSIIKRKKGKNMNYFNEQEFKIAVIRANTNYEFLAASIGMSKSKFYNVLKNGGNFKISEINKMKDVLGLNANQINIIFFASKLA